MLLQLEITEEYNKIEMMCKFGRKLSLQDF